MNAQSLRTLAGNRRMKITAITLCLVIFTLAIVGTIRISQATAARRTKASPAMVPTTVTVCKQVEDNNDADHTQGGTFGFTISDQSNTLGSPSLTRIESQSANPPVCSAPISVPVGSTVLNVAESAYPPTSTWPRNEGGYPVWTATNGTTTINGSGDTPADLSTLTGNVTITFSNRVGRKLTLCKLVQPNAIAPNNQGGTWNIQAYFPPVSPGGTLLPITADETSGTVCLPPISLPEDATQVEAREFFQSGTEFPGFPKYAWTTTGGQSASGTIETRVSVPVATTSGDITITLINKFDEPRVLNVCTQLLNNGDATSDGGEFTYITSFSSTQFLTPGMTESGPVVCSTQGLFNVPSSVASFNVGASQYPANWPGNAIGYPKWELRDGNNPLNDPSSLLASGTGDYTTVDFAALGVTNVRFVMIQQAGAFGNGSDPTTGKIMRICKQVDNNGDTTDDGVGFGFVGLEFGVFDFVNGFGGIFNKIVKESDGLVCDRPMAVHNGETEFQVKEAPVIPGWPGHAPGYPKWEVLGPAPANTALQSGTAVHLPSQYAQYLAAQINTTTLTGDSTFVMHNKAGSRKLKMCVNVMDNGLAPIDSAVLPLGILGVITLDPAITVEGGSTNCVDFGAPSDNIEGLLIGYAPLPWPSIAYGFPTYSYTTTGGGSGSGMGIESGGSFYAPFDFAAPANAGDITFTFTVKPGRRLTVCKQLLNNGDGINNSGTFGFSQGTNIVATNVNLTATEGGAVVCGTTDRVENYGALTQAIVQELTLPASWPGNTPGFPLFNWTTTGGQSGTGTGNSAIFDLTNTPGVSGIENTTGDITVTFFNRTGPLRTLTLCKEVEDNGDGTPNQGGVFTLTGGGNTGTPGSFPLTQTEGQPRVCSPPITLDPLSTTISATETAPGTWPGNADGFPQWSLLDGANATVTSGTGTPTGNLLLSSFTGNPTIVFRNRALIPATLSINDVTVTEGNSGMVNAVFTVSLAAVSSQTVTVQYATADGTANAPGDYTALPLTTLTFPPNTLTQTITVQVNGDTAFEPDETFFVNLINPTFAVIADNQGQGTILNDDCPPAITFTPASLPTGTVNTNYSQTVTASPAGGNYSYAVTGGALPAGFLLNAATGEISGTTAAPGYYAFTLTATGFTGCTGSTNYSIFINCPGATITVTTAADTVALDGGCSLREAIQAANNNAPVNECPAGVPGPNSDFIYFYIGTGTPTINITSALPTLTERVEIDGAKCQSTRVELNGALAGASVDGLTLTASDSAILSMVINSFSLDGLVIANSSNNIVENCLIGTDKNGVAAQPNRDGLLLNNATNNRIGGLLAGQRNVISGNTRSGLLIDHANGNQVLGNLVGTDISGLLDVGNGVSGLVLNFSDNCAVGGAATGAGNVFSGNNAHGVVVQFSSNTLVQGNKVGTAENGTAAVGNGLDGVIVVATSQNNRIGGNPNEANVIAFNGRNGVTVNDNFGPAFNNAILTNSIHSNAQLGIDLAPNQPLTLGVTLNDAGDLDDGPNRFQNFPVLLNVTANQIQGTLDSAPGTYTLQFFNNVACDPSQHGEGQTFIGEMQLTVTGGGPQLFSFVPPSTLTAHDFITATATDALGNTSEFSECHQCEICPTITLTPTTLVGGSVGAPYTQPLTANGGTPPHTFILSSGTTAPPGLTLSSAGVLSGTPTQQGSFTFLVKAFAKDGCFGLQQYTVTIGCTGFTLTPAALPNGETGTLYSQTIGTNPAGAAASFTVTGGLAPPGLTLDAATGVFSGMPTTPGYYTFTVTAGSGACTASQNYVVFINCHGATITVTTRADTVAVDGGCSLREAIQAANGNTAVNECPAGNGVGNGLDKIYFYIGTGTPRIDVLSELPAIEQRVELDGSQCQATRVELNGANAGLPTPGLIVASGNSVVRGLVINRFGNVGLSLQVGGNNVVENCYLGTDASGTVALPNQIGVYLQSTGNRIGGTNISQRNVISGNQELGVYIVGSNASNNMVQGNYIGTAVNGLDPLGNSLIGVYIANGSGNIVGGSTASAGNIITGSSLVGVAIQDQPVAALHNRVLSNSIYGNGELGIDLMPGGLREVTQNDLNDVDTGPNNLQNFPVLTQAVALGITGTLNSTPNSALNAFTIQFFANPACDASGHGEGKTYLGQTTATTDANGNASFSFTPTTPLTPGEVVTATATDIDGNTSEFSACRTITACLALTVNPPILTDGTAGEAYNQTLMASGGTAPYSFALRIGTLPGGLTLNASSGVIAGVPTSFGIFNFTVEATDAGSCTGTRAYVLTIKEPCGTLTVNPAMLSNGFVGTAYNQTLTVTGGAGAYTFTRITGTLPAGLTLATSGALTGTPTTTGSFVFTIQATDANGCTSTPREYTVTVSGPGLLFYPLDTPVRALETRVGGLPLTGCVRPDASIAAGATFTLGVVSACTGIPANARAIIGNITVVPGNTGGYLTLFPGDAMQPTVANSNFKPLEVTNNVFTVGLGAADSEFKIFASATTHVIVDITGYFAPPGAGGLYFHALNEPVRLVETRTIPGLPGCIKPGAPFPAGTTEVQGRSLVASPCNVIPASARAIIGNVTTILPPTGGFLTIWPSDAIQPTVAASNYAGGDIVNGPFTVKLGADGKFKVFTDVATNLVIDILGYYSADAVDANGAGLLFNILPKPVRELETRPDFPGIPPLTGCFRTNAPIPGGTGGIRTQPIWGTCDGINIPNVARAIMGNVTVVNPAANPIASGFLTHYPGNVVTPPTVATSNYPIPVTFGYNRFFLVGLSPTDGTFKIFASTTTDVILDVSGYFAP